jgi:hypothetical protein
MLQILSGYLYPDTLAKLYGIEKNDYYITLCSKKLGHKVFTMQTMFINEYLNIDGTNFILLKQDDFIGLFNNEIYIKCNVENVRTIRVRLIISIPFGIDVSKLIDKIPRFFIEYYDHIGISIERSNDCNFICEELNLNLEIGNDIKEIRYKDDLNLILRLI